MIPRIAVTLGEPAGIGPDIVARLTQRAVAAQLVVVGDPALLSEAAAAHAIPLRIAAFDPESPRRLHMPGSVLCDPVVLRAPVVPGTLDRRNAEYVVETLARASDGCLSGRYDAMVTAPVHKGVINDAGVAFTGHIEFLAARARCDVVMLLTAERPDDERTSRSLHGLTHSLVNNMVVGVTAGYAKELEIVGVGYRAEAQGPQKLRLALGYSHPVLVDAPDGITFEVPVPTRVVVKGIDKEQVGQVAANIRSLRKPEPYKGKGIRYQGERIIRKAGKAGKK